MGVAGLVTAQFGDLCLYQWVGKISRQASEELRPSRNFTQSFSILPSKQNSQQLSTALGLTIVKCQHDFAKKKLMESEKLFVRRCLRRGPFPPSGGGGRLVMAGAWPGRQGESRGASAGVKGASNQGGGGPGDPGRGQQGHP